MFWVSSTFSHVWVSWSMHVSQVAYLGVVGGKSEDDTIERVLSATLSSQLASQFNWNGLRGKKCFRNLALCNVVFGTLSKKCILMFWWRDFSKFNLWYVPSTGVRLFTGGEIDQFMRGMIPCYLFNYFFVYIYCSEINNLCSMLNVLS